MKVSIITATYNSEATIRDTLESVKRQTYSNIEHVIIDGLSRDSTVKVVKEVSPSAKCYSEADSGIYDAMNRGIEKVNGDIIGILNSDDYYASDDVIQKVVETMKRSGCDTLYGDLKYIDKDNTEKVVRKWKAGEMGETSFQMGWMPPHPTFFVRREVYEKYGTFDTRLRSSADYELMLRFLYKNQVSTCYLPECLVHMRTGGQSNVSVKNRIRANKEDRMAWQMNGLTPKFYTLYFKPIRKVLQYL